MSERSARAGGQQRGDHPPAVAQGGVSDRVDALVNTDQPPVRQFVSDLVARVSERSELGAPDGALLPRGQPSP